MLTVSVTVTVTVCAVPVGSDTSEAGGRRGGGVGGPHRTTPSCAVDAPDAWNNKQIISILTIETVH